MRRLLLVLLLVASLTAVARGALPCHVLESQPACWVALRPGPVEDALGVTTVAGTETFASSGELLLTTVAVEADVDLLEWIANGLNPRIDQVERARVFPEDTDEDQVRRENAVLMRGSQQDATLAALAHLGYDLDAIQDGAEVTGLTEPTSVDDGQLEVGDVIVAVDGRPTLDSAAVGAAVRSREVGDALAVTFRRGGQERTTEIELISSPGRPDAPMIGVLLVSHLALPVDVDIDAGAIGGPSAGLPFALAVVDLLGPVDLTGGAVVAATGTIEPGGEVGGVGGVTQKILGALDRADQPPATVFLVPRDNLATARAAPVDRELLLVPVDTLTDAVRALEDLAAGRTPTETYALGPGG